jgi:hypothetical protein
MLIYLLILVVFVVLYRWFKEGFNNPFGEMEPSCLYNSDNKPPVKHVYKGSSTYTNENDFLNYNYYSILNKTDSNVYLSKNKPQKCRI